MTVTEPLENLKDTSESNLLSLISGHDTEADRRQRNREFVSSNKHGKSWKLVPNIPSGRKEGEV